MSGTSHSKPSVSLLFAAFLPRPDALPFRRDTVASVGFIPRAALPFSSSSNPSVRHFRQALALDEHRAKFKANHWIDALNDISTSASVMEQRTTAAKEGHSAKLVEVFGTPAMAKNRRKDVSSGVRMDLEGTRSAEELKKDVKEAAEEVAFSKRQGGREWETTVEEVWFTGAHCGRSFIFLFTDLY